MLYVFTLALSLFIPRYNNLVQEAVGLGEDQAPEVSHWLEKLESFVHHDISATHNVRVSAWKSDQN